MKSRPVAGAGSIKVRKLFTIKMAETRFKVGPPRLYY